MRWFGTTHCTCVDCVCVLQTIVCHAIPVTGQTMNFHDYCHRSCHYWIRVMVHANTRHGCQGHVMTEHEFWIGSCDYSTWLSQVMRWLDISSKYCHGSMTGDDCYGSWLGCLSFDDYHGLCDDWAWGLKAVMGHATTGHHCNSWYAECACFFFRLSRVKQLVRASPASLRPWKGF